MALPKPCNQRDCPEVAAEGKGQCPTHLRARDRERGTSSQRGYNSAKHKRFRRKVLLKDPVCVVCTLRLSTVADHWPQSKKALDELGLDSSDPAYGRGLCHPCHSRETGRLQPNMFGE